MQLNQLHIDKLIKAVVRLDSFVKKMLTVFCSIFLLMMVLFTVYTVVMRYVFLNPPIWGDLLTVLSNIWLVFFALALTVRDKDYIALDLIYSYLPLKVAFGVRQFWSIIICLLGVVMIIYGIEAVATMGGKYWEMGYIAWENGGLVLKAHYMPKKYAIAIVPISGVLVSIAALASIIEDSFRLRAGVWSEKNIQD